MILEPNKAFVGSLNYATTEAELKKEFEKFGTIINIRIVTDHATGKSRGFAYITFADDKSATECIAQMNDQLFGGRRIGVKPCYRK